MQLIAMPKMYECNYTLSLDGVLANGVNALGAQTSQVTNTGLWIALNSLHLKTVKASSRGANVRVSSLLRNNHATAMNLVLISL
jgi:hypothetical protein